MFYSQGREVSVPSTVLSQCGISTIAIDVQPSPYFNPRKQNKRSSRIHCFPTLPPLQLSVVLTSIATLIFTPIRFSPEYHRISFINNSFSRGFPCPTPHF